jgi:competence ComEA-like helix-hairpin-helix protein
MTPGIIHSATDDLSQPSGASASADRGVAWALLLLVMLGTSWGWWSLLHSPVRNVAERPARSVALKLDVNTATVGELCALPGVGETLAERIVEHRKKRGGLRNVEQLLAVQGMGQRTLENVREFVWCSEPGWVSGAAGRGDDDRK